MKQCGHLRTSNVSEFMFLIRHVLEKFQSEVNDHGLLFLFSLNVFCEECTYNSLT